MNALLEFLASLMAKIFGVALDRSRKPEQSHPTQPVVLININNSNRIQSKSEGARPLPIVVTPPDIAPANEPEPETFTDQYWEELAVDLTKKVRPKDRLILRDKRYAK